jgi:hypothetical protein
MRFRILVGIALLLLAVDYAGAYDLDRHLWRDRLLFLVAPNAEDTELADQLRWIERRREAVLDRDLRVFQLFVDQGRVDDQMLAPASVRLLRARLGLAEQDRLVILIGKDGGVKRRAALNTDLAVILREIDGMPMRQQEIRAKQKAGIEVTPP